MKVVKLIDIGKEISNRTGYNRQEVMVVLDLVFPIILETLFNGDDVMIKRFGRFTMIRKEPHVCTDARTGKKTMSNYKAVIKFRISRMLETKLKILANPEYDWGDDYGENLFE